MAVRIAPNADASQRRSPFGNIAGLTYVGLIIVSLVVFITQAFFMHRDLNVDELGLFNPIYTELTTGRMTYPIHYYPDFMTVHPPLHYLIIANLMRAGTGLYYAEVLPAAVLFLVCLVITCTGRFDRIARLGLVFGLTTAVSTYTYWTPLLFGVRPELHLALAWFAGLLALEAGRLADWDWRWLLGGSFLMAYASGLHYYGVAALPSLAVYAAWLLADRQATRRQIRFSRLLALAGGAVLFIVPELILFVLPYLEQIRAITAGVQGSGGPLDALSRHQSLYRGLADLLLAGLPATLLPTVLLAPWGLIGVPPSIIGVGLLAWHRQTRGIALASIPLLACLLAYSQGKSAGYLTADLLIFLSGVGVLIARLIEQRAPHRALAPGLLLALMLAWVGPALARGGTSFGYQVHQQEIARAAALDLLGPGAVVGGRIGAWYITGATHWYNVEAELLWRDISTTPRAETLDFLRRFDAIGEHWHFSYVTINKLNASLGSWYADSTLNLRGFYLGRGHPDNSYLLLRVDPLAEPLRGYVLAGEELRRFSEDQGGDRVLVAAVCPTGPAMEPIEARAEYWTSLPLPRDWARGPNAQPPTVDRPYTGADVLKFQLIALLVDYDVRPHVLVALGERAMVSQDLIARAGCTVRDWRPGRTEPADRDALLATSSQAQPIQFYRRADDLPAPAASR